MLTDQHKPNHFAFFTPSKNYHLRAETTRDAEKWVENLKETLESASQQVLSSSFKRLSTLDEVAKDFGGSFNPPPLNRHSITMGPPLASKQGAQYQQHFPKRHSVSVTGSTSLLSIVKQQQQQQQPGEANPLNKLVSPVAPAKASMDGGTSLSKSLESSGTSRASYATNSLFSGREEGQSSYPSDHGSPTAFSSNIIDDSVKKQGLSQSNVPAAAPAPASAPAPAPAPPATHARHKTEADDPEQVLESGHLLRLKKRSKRWTDQYVVLSSSCLAFYKSERQTKTPVKLIPIENLIDVVEMDAMSRSKQFCMQVITPEKRMRFCAPGEEDLIRWLAAIKAVIDASPHTASLAYDQIEEE